MQYVVAVAMACMLACGDNRAVSDHPPGPQCGDRMLDPGEACDDGNAVDGDGCSAACTVEPFCGDGVVDPARGEECDDGVIGLSGDGCSSRCRLETWQWERRTPHARLAPRAYAAIAFDATHGQLVMFGGRTTTVEGDTRIWNGSTWVAVAPATSPPPRYGHTLTYDRARGVLVLIGGADATDAPRDDQWEWDGVTWTERTPTTRPPARARHGAAYDDTRHVLVVFGGRDAAGQLLGDTWEWDGATWADVTTAGGPSPRAEFAMSSAGARGVMVTGGPDTFLWDGQTWTMSTEPWFPGYRGAAAYDRSRDRVIGSPRSGSAWCSGQSETWDGTAWLPLASLPQPSWREGMAMTFDEARNEAVLFGGRGYGEYGDTWSFDGTSWREATGGAPRARAAANLAYDELRQRVLMFGGVDSVCVSLRDTWQWDGVAWQAIESPTSPPDRYWAGLAFDPVAGQALLFGGVSNQYVGIVRQDPVYRGDTWTWDGAAWTELAPATSPPPGPSLLAYDRARGKFVLFSTTEQQTWQWDGASWSQRFPAHTPPNATNQNMVYDARREVVVLHTQPGETWEWDGSDWIRRVSPTAPPGGDPSWLVYDPTAGRVRAQVEIFVTSTREPSQTWTWDGATWNQETVPPVPVPTTNLQLTFDAARDEVLGFGLAARTDPGEPTFETWGLARRAPDEPRETCVHGEDADGDGLQACADPDCWPTCAPACPPRTSCDPAAPHCGDGMCSAIEDRGSCPADC